MQDKFKWDSSSDSNMTNVIESHCTKWYKNQTNKMHGHYKGLVEKSLDPRTRRSYRVRSNEDWERPCDNIINESNVRESEF